MKLLKIGLKIEKLLEMLDDLVGKGEGSEGELKDRDNAVMARSPRKGDARRLLGVPYPQRQSVWGRSSERTPGITSVKVWPQWVGRHLRLETALVRCAGRLSRSIAALKQGFLVEQTTNTLK